MKNLIAYIFALTLISTGLFASNPVTLVSFYQEFNQLEEVRFMEESGILDGRVIPFLLDENNALIEKAAVLNALANADKPKRNASVFKQFVARKYRQNFETMDLNLLNGDELFCLGYLTLVDDLGKADNALPILEMSIQKNSESFTANLIYAMALAQKNIQSGKNCEAWKNFTDIQQNTSLKKDMSDNILTYFLVEIEPYKTGCE